MYQIHDNSQEAVLDRFNYIETKRTDILKRMNEELKGSPYSGLIKVVTCNTSLNRFIGNYDVTFVCLDHRKLIVTGEQFFHIYHQQQKCNYRVNNLIKSYLGCVGKLVKKYADQINQLYKYPLAV